MELDLSVLDTLDIDLTVFDELITRDISVLDDLL